jgi:hypothetical protein
MHYNWIADLLAKRNGGIIFSKHLLDKQVYWHLDLDKVEETVKTGSVAEDKCGMPCKICFERYFGKENITYVVIAWFEEDYIEVKTEWSREGR